MSFSCSEHWVISYCPLRSHKLLGMAVQVFDDLTQGFIVLPVHQPCCTCPMSNHALSFPSSVTSHLASATPVSVYKTTLYMLLCPDQVESPPFLLLGWGEAWALELSRSPLGGSNVQLELKTNSHSSRSSQRMIPRQAASVSPANLVKISWWPCDLCCNRASS